MKKTILIIFSVFILFSFHKAKAAVLYSQTAQQDVYEGQTFVMDWFLDTQGKSVNSLDLKLNFSKDILKALEADSGNSLINLWIKTPTIDNDTGTIEMIGGIPNGAVSSRFAIFRVSMLARKTGTASITLGSSSAILLNDGAGTSEVLQFKNEMFNVYPQEFLVLKINSPTHPDQRVWYQNHDVKIKFSPQQAEQYSYSFSSNIEIIPDNAAAKVPEEFNFLNQPDGIYYFKLNSKVGPSAWKEAGVFRIQIDSTPPSSFVPLIGSDPNIYSGSKFLSFAAVDKTSGISHYKVKVGLFGRVIETKSPYKLQKPFVGDQVVVTAYDNAGNSIGSAVAWKGFLSINEFKWLLILLGILALAINSFIGKQIQRSNQNQ